jgi:Tfp pilus assembly protein FimT
MPRRFILMMVFVTTGFVAGLVLTGRMRTAEDSLAAQPTLARTEAAPQGRPP